MDSRKLSMESVTRFEAQKVEQIRRDARKETLEEVLAKLEPITVRSDVAYQIGYQVVSWLWAELEKVK